MKLLCYNRELNNKLEIGMKLDSYNRSEYMRDIHERHEHSKVGWSEQCEQQTQPGHKRGTNMLNFGQKGSITFSFIFYGQPLQPPAK
jgi:hypothetical protein